MRWHVSDRVDTRALPLADRHYSRQQPGTPQFVPPGRCFVLLTAAADALWVTGWPFAEYVRHAWAGAWINSFFRNESPNLSSELIREAIAATRAFYGEPPALGVVTFVDAGKVRHKRDPGRCYLRAGFQRPPCPHCGGYAATGTGRTIGVFQQPARCEVCVDGRARTKGGLLVFQMLPEQMPPPALAHGAQPSLFAVGG